MGREKLGSALTARGMSVQACPMGTGVVIRQSSNEEGEHVIHLSVAEARELAGSLVVEVQRHHAIQSEISISSLYVQGLALEEIALRLDITTKDVLNELTLRGFIRMEK
jgi:DNA-binding NarL/FixJ family response regulator